MAKHVQQLPLSAEESLKANQEIQEILQSKSKPIVKRCITFPPERAAIVPDDSISDELEGIPADSTSDSDSPYGWTQVIDLESCAASLKSILSDNKISSTELYESLDIPDDEFDIFDSLLQSLAECVEDETWILKKPSLDDKENGMVAIWSATKSVNGATYKQATKNLKTFMKIHDIPESRLNSIVFEMYDKDKTTYMQYPLFRPKRREPYTGMWCCYFFYIILVMLLTH